MELRGVLIGVLDRIELPEMPPGLFVLSENLVVGLEMSAVWRH
jgi:hypothetical protein